MSENITINLEGLSKEEREQLLRLIEKTKRAKKIWKPECGEWYWFIGSDGQIDNCEWANDRIDRGRYSMGNCFKTKEEAEFAREKQKIKIELQRFADEHNDPEKLEWDGLIPHYVIAYSYPFQTIRGLNASSYYYSSVSVGDLVYFTSVELVMEAIELIGKERLLKYLFGVDCEEC